MSVVVNIVGIAICLLYVGGAMLGLILWACAWVAEKLLAIFD